MGSMLYDKSTNYLFNDEIEDYKKTKRVFGQNSQGISAVYDLTYEPTYISHNIFLGNAYNARNYYELISNNIGLIINCSADIPHYFEEEFEYVRVNVYDQNNQDISPYLNEVSDTINRFKLQNPDKNVLIHCFMGSSRSASILMGYLIKYEHYKTRDALNYLKDKRDIVNINIDFFTQLIKFEREHIYNKKDDSVPESIIEL
tara:strand:+ start:3398 stop:4003 length:606 start_codon:yes stop_codon:yes gene_type:complete